MLLSSDTLSTHDMLTCCPHMPVLIYFMAEPMASHMLDRGSTPSFTSGVGFELVIPLPQPPATLGLQAYMTRPGLSLDFKHLLTHL